jgi:hypothetical protein
MCGSGCAADHARMLLILLMAAAGTLIPALWLSIADRTPRPAG